MIELSKLYLFMGAALVLLLIPGPAVLYITARSASQGRMAGLVSVLAIETANFVQAAAAALGLSAILLSSALAFDVVKYLGAAYLIYLGIRRLFSRLEEVENEAMKRESLARIYWQGFVVNILNPKVAIFFLAFLPQFVDRDHGPVWSQTLALGLLYIGLGLCSDSLYVVVGAKVGQWLGGRAEALGASRYAEAGILVGLGMITLALPHQRAKR